MSAEPPRRSPFPPVADPDLAGRLVARQVQARRDMGVAALVPHESGPRVRVRFVDDDNAIARDRHRIRWARWRDRLRVVKS